MVFMNVWGKLNQEMSLLQSKFETEQINPSCETETAM